MNPECQPGSQAMKDKNTRAESPMKFCYKVSIKATFSDDTDEDILYIYLIEETGRREALDQALDRFETEHSMLTPRISNIGIRKVDYDAVLIEDREVVFDS